MSKFLFSGLVALLLSSPTFATSPDSIQIEEEMYEGRDHFVVHTPTATYWYDQAGGAFSRILDVEGNDWVGFSKEPLNEYPASAAAGFRGLPNFVFRSADGGAGHPGFDQCHSEVLDEHRIRTRSLSGKWQWTWTFYPAYATVTMEKVDSDHAYWFLYEGTPGGFFSPDTYYWGTDTEGYQTHIPDYYAGETVAGNWQWAYFGERSVERVLYLGMVQPDNHEDLLGFLGNTTDGLASEDGMVVFGFGRQIGATPLITTSENTFLIGFLEQSVTSKTDHQKVAERIIYLIEEQ